MSNFDGGFDTCRVPGTVPVDEQQRQEARRADARGNTAAIEAERYCSVARLRAEYNAGVKDRAEAWAADVLLLLHMLGLTEEAERPPGICRRPGCGRAYPPTDSISSRAGDGVRRRKGYCSVSCLEAHEGATS